jgi:hypothetical protein
MSHKTLIFIYHSHVHSHELWNNVLRRFLPQYTNFSDAKESNPNYYEYNSVDALITQPPKTELAVFSFRESFPHKFLQIINIPITGTEDNMHKIHIKK